MSILYSEELNLPGKVQDATVLFDRVQLDQFLCQRLQDFGGFLTNTSQTVPTRDILRGSFLQRIFLRGNLSW
jgi:hypothetical protein